jgi:stress-induced morphogen
LNAEEIERLKQSIANLENQLSQQDIQTEIYTLEGRLNAKNLDSLSFSNKKTDLSSQLQEIQKNYENRNLSGVLLISDGMFNRGSSPLFANIDFNLSTFGIGDTNQIKDIWINDVSYNEIAFLDNYFPVKVKIQQEGFVQCKATVNIKKGDKLIERKNIEFKNGETLKEIDFKILADKEGQQNFVVKVVSNGIEEKTLLNNSQNIYLEVIEGKDKVLIMALSPHPDIKCIKNALAESNNYEVTSYFSNDGKLPEGKFDMVIMHQIPNLQNLGNGYVEKFMNEKTPIWFILGPSSNLFFLNRHFNGLRISSKVSQTDEVNPLLNENFKKFNFPESSLELLPKLPPMTVPFAKYDIGEGTETVLFQSVGRINTGKPLLAIHQKDDIKNAILAGDGLWRWRMYEYSNTKKFEFTNALINKVTQLLSLKEDKRKFRINIKNSKDLFEGLTLIVETEMYNDIYENIFNNEVELKITNEKNETAEYNYLHTQNSDFEIRGLNPGIYNYSASTVIDEKKYSAIGQFQIKKLQLEDLQSRADFDLLKTLANKNNGIYLNDLNSENVNQLIEGKSQGLIHSREINIDIISLFWIFFVILLFISSEWFIRKYSGAY